jgi:hypothetical protein
MSHSLRRWPPAAWLLTLLLAGGCQHHRPCCPPCGTVCNAGTPGMGAPVAVNNVPGSAAASGPTLDGPANKGPAGAPAMLPNPPAGVDPLLNLAPPPRSSGTQAAPAAGHLTPLSYQTPPVDVPAAGGYVASAKFAHDAAYHRLVGTLDYSRIQQAWVLRYVPVEEDDRYGGCVTLVVPSRKMKFRRGQTVRVEGELIDPESQQLRPAFEVQDIKAE